MELLPADIIINDILQLVFPHNSALFLTCKYFNNLQKKYYEQLGCVDTASKNFMHIIMGMNNVEKIKMKFNQYAYSMVKYDLDDIIPFATDTLTMLMNSYLELFVGVVNSNFSERYHNANIRTQIILLMAEKSIARRNFSHSLNYIIVQLLSHKNDDPYIIQLQKKERCENMAKNTVLFNVNLVNVFYAIIGIKRAYILQHDYYAYWGCESCGADTSDYYCKCPEPYKFITANKFTVILKDHPGTARYFEHPTWYNKIYSSC
jgi:hypothetical protein